LTDCLIYARTSTVTHSTFNFTQFFTHGSARTSRSTSPRCWAAALKRPDSLTLVSCTHSSSILTTSSVVLRPLHAAVLLFTRLLSCPPRQVAKLVSSKMSRQRVASCCKHRTSRNTSVDGIAATLQLFSGCQPLELSPGMPEVAATASQRRQRDGAKWAMPSLTTARCAHHSTVCSSRSLCAYSVSRCT